MGKKIKVMKVVEGAVMPKYATAGASGFDLSAVDIAFIGPGERKLISTGLAFEIPKGYELQVRPRSGLALKQGVTVLNSPGTIDSDYRGVVGVVLINHGKDIITVLPGERIAQGVIMKAPQYDLIEVEELTETSRGKGGFGSTGV